MARSRTGTRNSTNWRGCPLKRWLDMRRGVQRASLLGALLLTSIVGCGGSQHAQQTLLTVPGLTSQQVKRFQVLLPGRLKEAKQREKSERRRIEVAWKATPKVAGSTIVLDKVLPSSPAIPSNMEERDFQTFVNVTRPRDADRILASSWVGERDLAIRSVLPTAERELVAGLTRRGWRRTLTEKPTNEEILHYARRDSCLRVIVGAPVQGTTGARGVIMIVGSPVKETC